MEARLEGIHFSPTFCNNALPPPPISYCVMGHYKLSITLHFKSPCMLRVQ